MNIHLIKGIISDSNNIFLWHESEDINKKGLFPKFQLIPILRLQVMHDYVHWHWSTDYRCKIKSCQRNFMQKLLLFHTEKISAQFLWGNVLLGGELQTDTKKKKSNFAIFESPLYMKFGSMPLSAYHPQVHCIHHITSVGRLSYSISTYCLLLLPIHIY